VENNKQWLGSNAKPPSSVAIMYLNTSGLTVNQVDAEIDWDFSRTPRIWTWPMNDRDRDWVGPFPLPSSGPT
jgi:hypothetical protein